jgi:hypothetical protein
VRIIFLSIYIISTFLTIFLFMLINILTESLETKKMLGVTLGNGNPNLFPILFLPPFLLLFLYGTIRYSYRFIFSKFGRNTIIYTIGISLIISGFIIYLAIKEAINIRSMLIEQYPNLSDSNVALLNSYTNSAFFNLYTFVMIILICFSISGLRILYKRQR